MTRYIINLLTLLCICCFLHSCSQEEESSLTVCDNEGVSNRVREFEEVLNRAVSESDCETILSTSTETVDFIDDNYNCLVIYYVLTDNGIETDREAEDHLATIKEYVLGLSHQCETEIAPSFN
ncbi:hypothetical protein [Flammeovirga sp. OC4]|uniref:hypothetical protein n=1 Tax=Flammeovirga sp. OC4 TaxID=1382345 RepID=UPI0012E0C2B4|nr:hypothetical protein [Flammeovirga sp. OC4]